MEALVSTDMDMFFQNPCIFQLEIYKVVGGATYLGTYSPKPQNNLKRIWSSPTLYL